MLSWPECYECSRLACAGVENRIHFSMNKYRPSAEPQNKVLQKVQEAINIECATFAAQEAACLGHTCWTMKRPFLGSRMSTAIAIATTKATIARPKGAARQEVPLALNANARLPPRMTATASPVKIRACPRLHAVARVVHFMAQALFKLSTNAQPLILNLDVLMPECAVEALHRTEVWEGFPESRLWRQKRALSRACKAEGQLT